MTSLEYILSIHRFGAGGFWSIETPKKVASGSEIRRWMNNGAIVINGIKVKPSDELPFPIQSVVLFPNSKKRITVY